MKHYYNLKKLFLLCLGLGVTTAWGQVTVFNYTGDFVTYTVPAGVSSINIEALGAQGASGQSGFVGGKGARMSGDFSVTPGSQLLIAVGGKGSGQSSGSNGGGGGGSFVMLVEPAGTHTMAVAAGPFAPGTKVTPLIIAGGGGGTRASTSQNGNPGVVGNLGTSSSASSPSGGGTPVTAATMGGIAASSSWGSGGGGLVGNGGNDGSFGCGGKSFINGAQGGTLCGSSGDNAAGGFGCGGQGRGSFGGGGGGGYSGGQGGWVGGGGGSFNTGADQVNENGFKENDGQVTISVNCSGITLDVTEYSLCVGEEVTVTATSMTGGTITWDMGVLNGVPFAVGAGATTITATSTSPEDCGLTVTVFGICCGLPDASGVADPSELCVGEGYVVSGLGEGFVEFQWGAGVEDGETIIQETAGTFVHTVIGFAEDGCSDTSTVMVVVHPLPIVLAGMNFTVCEDTDIMLTGSGAEDYAWDMGVTDGVVFPALVGETTYTVTGTDANGCSDEDEIIVTGVDVPEISSSVVVDEYFGYDGSIDITVTGGSGSYIYEWSHGPTTEDVSALTTGIYTVTIDDITIDKGFCPYEETFLLNSFVDVDETTVSTLNAYPNPTTDLLTVVFEGQFNYQILNVVGEVVANGSANGQTTVSMADLANGTYIIKVMAGDVVNFVQVVKQ